MALCHHRWVFDNVGDRFFIHHQRHGMMPTTLSLIPTLHAACTIRALQLQQRVA